MTLAATGARWQEPASSEPGHAPCETLGVGSTHTGRIRLTTHLHVMIDWLRGHETLLEWLIVVSVAMLVISVAAVGWVIVRVPSDYFARSHEGGGQWAHRHPLVRLALIIGKNILGLVLVAAGVLMLVLPGQGVLTILAGVLLLDIPGKHRVVMWFVRQPAVLKSMNWIRERAGREPLTVA